MVFVIDSYSIRNSFVILSQTWMPLPCNSILVMAWQFVYEVLLLQLKWFDLLLVVLRIGWWSCLLYYSGTITILCCPYLCLNLKSQCRLVNMVIIYLHVKSHAIVFPGERFSPFRAKKIRNGDIYRSVIGLWRGPPSWTLSQTPWLADVCEYKKKIIVQKKSLGMVVVDFFL